MTMYGTSADPLGSNTLIKSFRAMEYRGTDITVKVVIEKKGMQCNFNMYVSSFQIKLVAMLKDRTCFFLQLNFLPTLFWQIKVQKITPIELMSHEVNPVGEQDVKLMRFMT